MSNELHVDSSSRFPLRARTHRHTVTDTAGRPTHASATIGPGNEAKANSEIFEL